MKKPIAIIAGEPNSISSEIIFKIWKKKNKYKHKPILIIGSAQLLNLQKKKLKYKIPIKILNSNFKQKDLLGNMLPVYNISYNQKRPFEKLSYKSNKYIFNCFNIALKLIKEKKILGLINCPVAKEFLFKKKYQGITEYLAKKTKSLNNEVMLLYNKNLSVSTLTTHVPLRKVSNQINKSVIVKKIIVINNFYKKIFNKKPKIAVLGLNPHNFSGTKIMEEKEIIYPAIKIIRNKKINAVGPISPDTSFMMFQKNKYDVIFGMYHDQVLTSFKALFNYNAINITLGLPFIRISPDHGTAENIIGKNLANPDSLIDSIKFFNKVN
tara:strand:- start:4204 stop:5175 length:972 start_codon:yes stop_codon:yes gene_type:complete